MVPALESGLRPHSSSRLDDWLVLADPLPGKSLRISSVSDGWVRCWRAADASALLAQNAQISSAPRALPSRNCPPATATLLEADAEPTSVPATVAATAGAIDSGEVHPYS